jgi:uncharacterized cupredoxin-like copper-binding protein
MLRTGYAAVGLAVLAIGSAGCGDDNDDNGSASAPATTPAAPTTTKPATTTGAAGGGAVTISETEFKLTPKDATTKAGKVTIDAKNDGQTVHNLEVEGQGVEKKTADLQPGDSAKLSLDLKPGKYEMYCAIPGHRTSGMEGTLTVS